VAGAAFASNGVLRADASVRGAALRGILRSWYSLSRFSATASWSSVMERGRYGSVMVLMSVGNCEQKCLP
jgi:hypothetical protein